MKNFIDTVCGPLEYRWSVDPVGYKQIEIYRDAPPAVWDEAQAEVDSFTAFSKRSSLGLCVYLFPLDDNVWHRLSAEAVTVLRALTP